MGLMSSSNRYRIIYRDFTFKNSSKDKFSLNIPNDIARFKDLQALNLVGCVSSLPDAICDLPNLQYLSLVDNPNLQQLPECLANMQNLMVVNVPGASGKTSFLNRYTIVRNKMKISTSLNNSFL